LLGTVIVLLEIKTDDNEISEFLLIFAGLSSRFIPNSDAFLWLMWWQMLQS